MADGVWKGVQSQVIGRSRQLSLNKFFYPSAPSLRKVDVIASSLPPERRPLERHRLVPIFCSLGMLDISPISQSRPKNLVSSHPILWAISLPCPYTPVFNMKTTNNSYYNNLTIQQARTKPCYDLYLHRSVTRPRYGESRETFFPGSTSTKSKFNISTYFPYFQPANNQ